MRHFDVTIIGAGAAGLFCAIRAGQLGRRVLVLERGPKVGAKIAISGGGRCNFTNRHISSEQYLSENRHFCVSALKSYTSHDFISLVEKHKIAYHEKSLGQLFCNGSSQQIIDMLIAECAAAHVEIKTDQEVQQVRKDSSFVIRTSQEEIHSSALVVATGGLSIPKMGATDIGYKLAEQFGLPLTAMEPALVPLTFTDGLLTFMRELAGVSLPVTASLDKAAFGESMVFTHRGLSGPAILQISSYWMQGRALSLDLAPGHDVSAFLNSKKRERPHAELKTILSEILPQRLAQSFVLSFFNNGAMRTMSENVLNEVATAMKKWVICPDGSEGYAKAEVTRGGVSTHVLSSKTMEARDVPGLYFIGEVVDVTGWLGGYSHGQ